MSEWTVLVASQFPLRGGTGSSASALRMTASGGSGSGAFGVRGRDLLLVLVTVAVYTPYVIPALGIRGEQLVAYPVFAALLVSSKMTRREWRLVSAVPIAWGLLIPIGFLGSLYRVFQPNYELSWRSLISSVDSIAVGAAMAWIGSVVVIKSRDPFVTFRKLALAVVGLTALNGVVSIASAFTDTTPWLTSFWSDNALGSTSVAVRALAGHRYSGIFNQPYEAGVAHSVGLLLWCYLFVRKEARTSWLVLLAVPLLVGGLLPVSKVFMLGGFPLALGLLVWRFRASFGRTVVVLTGVGAASVVAFSRLSDIVRPGDSLAYLFAQDTYSRVSGGRYGGGGGALGQLFSRLGESPLVGFGLDPQIGPFDNAVLAQAILGGVVGLVALGVLVWILANGVAKGFRAEASTAAIVNAALFALFVGSMLGAHPLLVNRAGSLLLLAFGGLRGLLLRPPPTVRRTTANRARPPFSAPTQ